MTTLGVGGFGKAKKVKWHGREAVVKYININQDPSATFATCTINRDMAKEEGRIMSLFKNRDSIAEIYAVDGHAIYMKYYPDGSLRSQLDQDNVYEDRYFMLDDIIAGLREIHGLNFVHSDLKASNILCETHERIRCLITDFGAARKKGSTPIAYTDGFVPPDFFKKPLCFEDDIYSLGKLCIELFTGIGDITGINYNNFNNKIGEQTKMKINIKDIEYISRDEIYSNYFKYIEPIINYMASMDLPILNADSINEFIDNIIFNYYGFAEYDGNLYIIEL